MLITHDRKGHSARTECTNQHTSADDASPSTPPRHTKCAGDTPDVLTETHEGIVHALRAQERMHVGVHEPSRDETRDERTARRPRGGQPSGVRYTAYRTERRRLPGLQPSHTCEAR